jgi:hypothetical protein
MACTRLYLLKFKRTHAYGWQYLLRIMVLCEY